MAYNKTFNPDALPAHAEPEEAAQRLSEAYRKSTPRPPSTSPNPTPPRRVSPHNVPPPSSQYQYQNPQTQSKPLPQQPQHITTNYSHSGHSSPAPPNSAAAQSVFSRLHSPPPSNYGSGPPPPRPSRSPRPVHTPAPPPSADSADLFPLFRAANASQSGTLSEPELSSALVNADYTSFDPHTIRVMMQMFDASGKGGVTYDEFVSLWRFLASWRDLFERFDEDRSGRISLGEFSKALVAFGYRLSQPFVGVLYTTFTVNRQDGRRLSGASAGMSFDLFVQACVTVKRLTDVFKGYDDDRDGYITMSFEEFLTECLKLREYLVR